jgi:hypothetical protein
MSSGFVSGGTTDAPIERSDEWLAAQAEIDANRARKAAEAQQQSSGRSLYEVLEANKGIPPALLPPFFTPNFEIPSLPFRSTTMPGTGADHVGVR